MENKNAVEIAKTTGKLFIVVVNIPGCRPDILSFEDNLETAINIGMKEIEGIIGAEMLVFDETGERLWEGCTF